MDEIDRYYDDVELAASSCVEQGVNVMDYLANLHASNPGKLIKIVSIRETVLISSDYEELEGYVSTGVFREYTGKTALALLAVWDDIRTNLRRKELKRKCKKYAIDQPIFSNSSDLYQCIRRRSNGNLDLELLDSDSFTNIDRSCNYERNGVYYKSDSFLNPQLHSALSILFKNSPIYIRLDPWYCSKHIEKLLLEHVQVPANPKWWKTLKIHPRAYEGASYCQPDPIYLAPGSQGYFEYKKDGVRCLEVVATRKSDGNLSMMLEELSVDINDPGLMYGRCIHLDTNAQVGTNFTDASLNHLDLAINVYESEAVDARRNSNLANGDKVEDASFRTHLLRIDNIPLHAVFLFVVVFFQSKTLINEWLQDQFNFDNTTEFYRRYGI